MTGLLVGIEGPVLAGKSTVVTTMTDRIRKRGVPCMTLPCFVDTARTRRMVLPDIVPADIPSQVAAVQFYLSVDRWRRAVSFSGVVLLDRTCWTLLAHTVTLAAMGLVDAVAQVQQIVNESDLKPTSLIYLDVSHIQQLARAATREGLPELLLDEMFNAKFRAFFQATQDEHHAHWVNANQRMPEVVDAVEAHILHSLKIAR